MKILKVKYLHDFKCEVAFSSGETKIADFEDFLKSLKINPSLNFWI